MYNASPVCIVLILLFASRIIFSVPVHEHHSDQLKSIRASLEQEDHSEKLISTSITHTSPVPEDLTTKLQNILICENIERQEECVAILERHLNKKSTEYTQLQILKDSGRLTDTILPISAAYGRYIELVEALLRNGLPVNKRYPSLEGTMLHVAAESGQGTLIALLLKHGADISVKDVAGDTPLHVAVSRFHPNAVKLLLDAGADVNVTNSNSETPFFLAIAPFNPQVVYFRLHVPLIRNEMKNAGCVEDNTIIKLLLEHGANTNIPDNQGSTPLHKAAADCNTTIVKLLIDGGANINATDDDNKTPLHLATESTNVPVVEYLVAMGCDKTITDNNGKTALDVAKKYNLTKIINILSRERL